MEQGTRPRRSWRSFAAPAAVLILVGGIGTLAAMSPGYDAQDVPRLETSVWVTRDDNLYARVNTLLGEIDTVRSVADPAGVVQAGSHAMVFTQGYGQAWPVDAANPGDLIPDENAQSVQSAANVAVQTPAGTASVNSAGDFVTYLTGAGEVYLGVVPDGVSKPASPRQLDPFADVETQPGEERQRYVAAAAAVNAKGDVAMYSADEGGVRRFKAASGEIGAPSSIAQAPGQGVELSLTFVGDSWVMFAPASGLLWIEGRSEPVATGLGGDALLQASASDLDLIYLADADGMVTVDRSSGEVTRVVEASGVAAAPVVVRGVAYGAWMQNTSAQLWGSDTGALTSLDVDATELADVRSLTPVFRTNADKAVLSETASGLLWTVPQGTAIPIDQWSLDKGQESEGTAQVDDVIEQEPPVAEPDTFGVRQGAVVSLPLLLNDHDPNKKDVLSVDAGSLTALDNPEFGQVSLVNRNQDAVIRVTAASGTASFGYAATDGVASSAVVPVNLTVVPDDVNTAPEWCPVDGCRQTWPTPQVAKGGYVTVPVLAGWVDAEGDAIALADAHATDPNAPVTVLPLADGTVAIRHLDPNGGESTIKIDVTVQDAFGLQTTKELSLRVTASPSLEVKPIAAVGAVNAPVQVDIDGYVRGGSGSYRLVDAKATQGRDDAFSVAPSSSTGTIEFMASEPGDYAATYTVEDTETLAQLSAVVRFTVPQSSTQLAAPPMTAFVRPGQDTTVDVLSESNSLGDRVLMLTSATTRDPALSVSVVGQALVRVSATTTASTPGPLGTAEVTFTDGAGNVGVTTLTVFLLPASHGIGPIAAPDTATVRAGEQVDVPVLANDVSPRGERIVLHPTVEGSGTEGELAFASGSTLRYLAPKTPGVYRVTYSAYLEEDPTRADTSVVTITVLPKGANKAPQPETVVSRVVAGRSVIIPIPLAGTDPDGDAVTVIDVAQPAAGQGAASVSGTGDSILYRAPGDGVDGGQVVLTYTVRDAQGAEATGVIKVGVLEFDQANVEPVTYSDYVSVELGSARPITVEPLRNDRDPMRGTLSITDVVPNADPDSPEYQRLLGLLDTSRIDEGIVLLKAGDVEGSQSYLYTTESDTSKANAKGLIVIGVSDTPEPERISVTDTFITAANRTELATGIDVVSGKVQWPTGDASQLDLQLWGDVPKGFTTRGNAIIGQLPKERTVVAFSLTGTGADGEQIVTYGFLRIPALDEMRVQQRADLKAYEVGEEKSVTIPVREALDLAPGDVVELRQDATFPVQRDQATCTRTGDGEVTYTAGREAPWRDYCSVAVRLEGQQTWSIVNILIQVEPKEAQAILNPISRTITPGAEDSIDLLSLVSWEGGRVDNLASFDFSDPSGTQGPFVVTRNGTTLQIATSAKAIPGTIVTLKVTAPQYGGLSTSITLKVGPALNEKPRGGTFTQQCDVSRGNCTITVIGVPSEYDPYAGTLDGGLTLENVGNGGSVVCQVATVTKLSATQVQATWPTGQRPVGGECVVDFTVADAQGSTAPGRLTLDILGYPQTPASVTTVGYTGTSVTLQVALGQATQAHPSVTDVVIYEGESQVPTDCAPSAAGTYRCTITGLVNGEQHTYTARAVNSVGESLSTSAETTWAYQAPTVSAATVTIKYNGALQSTPNKGSVEISITGADDIKEYLVQNNSATITRTGATTVATTTLDVGNQVVQIVPVSVFTPPGGGSSAGAAFTAGTVQVPGAPSFSGAASAPENGTTIQISSPALNTNFSVEPVAQLWMAWTGGTPTCAMNATRDGVVVTGADTSTSDTFTGMTPNTTYFVAVCATNGFGWAMTSPGSVFTWVPPAAPTGTLTYGVGGNASEFANGLGATWSTLTSTPSVDGLADFTPYYFYGGVQGGTSLDLVGGNPPVSVAYCLTADTGRCGPQSAVTEESGAFPDIATMSVDTDASDLKEDDIEGWCLDGGSTLVVTGGGGASGASFTVTPDGRPWGFRYTITPDGFTEANDVVLDFRFCPPGP